jgi:hypothetical protein
MVSSFFVLVAGGSRQAPWFLSGRPIDTSSSAGTVAGPDGIAQRETCWRVKYKPAIADSGSEAIPEDVRH